MVDVLIHVLLRAVQDRNQAEASQTSVFLTVLAPNGTVVKLSCHQKGLLGRVSKASEKELLGRV